MTACGERRSLLFLCYVRAFTFSGSWQRHILCFSLNMAPFGVKVACIEPGFFKTTVTDTQMLKNNLKKLWDRLPQDTKDDYGPTFLDTCELLYFR